MAPRILLLLLTTTYCLNDALSEDDNTQIYSSIDSMTCASTSVDSKGSGSLLKLRCSMLCSQSDKLCVGFGHSDSRCELCFACTHPTNNMQSLSSDHLFSVNFMTEQQRGLTIQSSFKPTSSAPMQVEFSGVTAAFYGDVRNEPPGRPPPALYYYFTGSPCGELSQLQSPCITNTNCAAGFTFAIWFQLASRDSDRYVFNSKRLEIFVRTSDRKMVVAVDDRVSRRWIVESDPIQPWAWTHLGVIFDPPGSNSLTLLFNGCPVASTRLSIYSNTEAYLPTYPTSVKNKAFLGCELRDGTRRLGTIYGRMDELWIWDEAKSHAFVWWTSKNY